MTLATQRPGERIGGGAAKSPGSLIGQEVLTGERVEKLLETKLGHLENSRATRRSLTRFAGERSMRDSRQDILLFLVAYLQHL